MTLGLSLPAFTLLHVIISLIGIGTGFIVVFGMMGGRRTPTWTAIFLVTTVLTNLTGFMFPYKGVTPGIVIGVLSTVVLAIAIYALYGGHLKGIWRGTYVISSVVALFFNFFVLIVQSFEKVPALKALAPTQTEAPFKIAQFGALVVFVLLGIVAFRKFRTLDRELAIHG
jgi:putative solute:sodium symporter small subunit